MPLSEERKKTIKRLMKDADIAGVSVAEFDQNNTQTTMFGNIDKSGTTPMEAASRSKPLYIFRA